MSVDEIHIAAPAKVNFGLSVLPVRSDGFHGIESIFQAVSLCDELIVTRADSVRCCTVLCADGTLPQVNTIATAYQAFCDVVPETACGVIVQLLKRIPVGGGLGGGSSDAAALVKALATLCDVRLSPHQKKTIAAQVGSDVFFFLEADVTGCAIVSGRGEVITPITPRTDIYLLLVFPGVSSGTKEAYALVDSWNERHALDHAVCADLERVYHGPLTAWNFANSFTPAITSRYPQIAAALEAVRATGACYAELSGSGSTVYGVFTSGDEAETAAGKLVDRWVCCVVRPVHGEKAGLVSGNGEKNGSYRIAYSES